MPVTEVGLRTAESVGAPCVIVPDGPDAPLASAPELTAPAVLAVLAPHTEGPLPVVATAAALDGSRGPPSGTLGALRTIVLRV